MAKTKPTESVPTVPPPVAMEEKELYPPPPTPAPVTPETIADEREQRANYDRALQALVQERLAQGLPIEENILGAVSRRMSAQAKQ